MPFPMCPAPLLVGKTYTHYISVTLSSGLKVSLVIMILLLMKLPATCIYIPTWFIKLNPSHLHGDVAKIRMDILAATCKHMISSEGYVDSVKD